MSGFGGITTARQLEKKWDSFKDEILSRSIDFPDDEKSRKERIEKSKGSYDFFKRTYFPEYFSDDPAPFHAEWDRIRKIDNEPILVEASRGFGKSTDFTFTDPVYRGLFQKSHFILIVSYSWDKAAVFTGRILLELKFNRRLNADFKIKFLKEDIGNIQFSIDGWKCCIKAFSVGQNCRGEIFYNHRPDTVRLDDIQDRKRAKSAKFVNNCIEWIFADLIPALNPKKFNCIVVATPMNDRCVVSELKNGDDDKQRDPMKSFCFPAIDKNGKAAWEKRFPLPFLEKLRKTLGSKFFDQEYMLIPMSLDERTFRRDWIRFYNKEEIEKINIKYALSWTDSSLTSKGDFKATVCCVSDGTDIYVARARVRKESVSKMLDGMYSIYKECNPALMYYEDYTERADNQTILQESIERKAEDMGYTLPLRAERNSMNKELRIEGTLSSEIENGRVLFLKDDKDQKIIIDQLLEFPDGKHDDGIDGLEGAVRKIREAIRKSRRNEKMPAPVARKIKRNSSIMEAGSYD